MGSGRVDDPRVGVPILRCLWDIGDGLTKRETVGGSRRRTLLPTSDTPRTVLGPWTTTLWDVSTPDRTLTTDKEVPRPTSLQISSEFQKEVIFPSGMRRQGFLFLGLYH